MITTRLLHQCGTSATREYRCVAALTYVLVVQDEIAGDAPDRLEYRLRQSNKQALAIDTVDLSLELHVARPQTGG